jgi:deferrochelatase/peroxidase EfeB
MCYLKGTPVDVSPVTDDPSIGADPQRNQNFDFNHPEISGFSTTSDQTHCPFSAHIRKTRPRSDLGNTNTNQIIRGGIPYGPEGRFRYKFT